MKFYVAALLTVILSTALSAPSPFHALSTIKARDGLWQPWVSNELEQGPCREVTLIFARGSNEPGNMGIIVGPQLCEDLKDNLGPEIVACQGVSGAYTAGFQDNFLPNNTTPEAISSAINEFDLARAKCPNTQIIAGGYSQGTAVLDGAIKSLPNDIKGQIKGVVLFGYTRNAQDKGQIPGYPGDQTEVYCASGDL
ncbi:cutinase, partial [Penicillium cataractarum]